MKKHIQFIIIIVLTVLIPINTGKAQILDGLGAANTDTAANTTIMVTQLSTLAALIEQMEEAGRVVKEALKIVKVAEQVQEAIKLAQLIESTICTMQEYEFYLQFALKNDCLVKFDFELINSKFSYTTNIINIAVTADNLLSSGERINSIKDAIMMLEGAMQKTNEFNEKMRMPIKRMIVEDYRKKQMSGLANISRY